MEMIEKFKVGAKNISNKLISIRRHIHSNPELSFQEFETVAFVKEQLLEMGINQITPMANTGMVAIIEGKNPNKKVIALRADSK
jgi:metal-dependent amidase/aminoacylase/carboxypeptidase family protein